MDARNAKRLQRPVLCPSWTGTQRCCLALVIEASSLKQGSLLVEKFGFGFSGSLPLSRLASQFQCLESWCRRKGKILSVFLKQYKPPLQSLRPLTDTVTECPKSKDKIAKLFLINSSRSSRIFPIQERCRLWIQMLKLVLLQTPQLKMSTVVAGFLTF